MAPRARTRQYLLFAVLSLFSSVIYLTTHGMTIRRVLVATDSSNSANLNIAKYALPLFPILDRTSTQMSWVEHNHVQLHALFKCLEQHNCKPNQDKIVILSSFHFRGALLGWNGGEDIWARCIVEALETLGHTYLYSESNGQMVQLYQLFPTLIHVVLMEEEDADKCFQSDQCVRSSDNPYGIPIYKLLHISWWPGVSEPLGSEWRLYPEPYLDQSGTYLGYSVEYACKDIIPHQDRSDRVYVMGKYIQYFDPTRGAAWSVDSYAQVTAQTGVQVVVGAISDPNPSVGRETMDLPQGMLNLGGLQQPQFIAAIKGSKALIGIGAPKLSPTPYESLCLGVPFVNPILSWDENNPYNREKWDSQHSMLAQMSPPYVYNVLRGDSEGFISAVKRAVMTPIESYVLPRMTQTAVVERLRVILAKDYEAMAAKILRTRKKSGEGKLFTM